MTTGLTENWVSNHDNFGVNERLLPVFRILFMRKWCVTTGSFECTGRQYSWTLEHEPWFPVTFGILERISKARDLLSTLKISNRSLKKRLNSCLLKSRLISQEKSTRLQCTQPDTIYPRHFLWRCVEFEMWKSSNAKLQFQLDEQIDKPFVNPVVSFSYLYIFVPAKSPGVSQCPP